MSAAQAVQPAPNQIIYRSLIKNITSTNSSSSSSSSSSSNTTQNAESIKNKTETMNEVLKMISDLGSNKSGP